MIIDETLSELGNTSKTNWKNPPKLSDLKQNLEDAKPSHDAQVARINHYLDQLNGTGSAKIKVPKGRSSIVPRLIRKQAEWRYPALSEPFLSTDELFDVRPVSWNDRKAAQQNELLLNNQFSTRINRVKFIDEFVRTVVDEGTVFVQVGWDFEEEEYEEEVTDFSFTPDPTFASELEALQQPGADEAEVPMHMKQALVMSMQAGVPMRPVPSGSHMEKRTRIVRNCPTLEVRNSKNLVIDPTCEGDLKRAKFVVYSFESSRSELRKNPNYVNLDQINLDTNSVLSSPDHAVSGDLETQNFNFKDKERQKFVVYEYWGFWDTDGSGILKPIVAAWVGNTLIRMQDNPFPDKALPFVSASCLPVRKSAYGEPDGALLEDNQRIVGAVTRGMIDILGRSANAQVGIRKDMLDATNRRKFDAGLDYEYNPSIGDPRAGVYMHTYAEIPASAQFMLQMQNLEAESMTGVKAYSQGIASQSLGDVAMGIRGALDAASKRELGILRRLSSAIVEIGRKVIAMNAVFLSEEEVVRVTENEFIPIRRDDLAGNFDLRLSISTPEEDNNKAEQLAFLLQTVGPNEDPEVRRMILADICRLRKMPDMAKRLEDYQPQPDPLEQEKLQLEVELLRGKLAEMQANAVKLESGSQLDQARAGTEIAKQGFIKSETDQKNLDFVEQESGVKQERELQKHGEQARSQAQLKQYEHALNAETAREQNKYDFMKEIMKNIKR